MRTILWFRRDLRLLDHPALLAASADGEVAPLLVLDRNLLRGGAPRVAYYLHTVAALRADLRRQGADLIVRTGPPEHIVPAVAAELGAGSVHISADHTPYGAARDGRVAAALTGTAELVRTGSPYAVSPGRVTKADGDPYRVFTPYFRAWLEHGWRAPASSGPASITWSDAAVATEELPDPPPHAANVPPAGEQAALQRWADFANSDLASYDAHRDRPDLDATSRLSADLKVGSIHPRTMLADLAHRPGDGPAAFRRQLAWRDFYAAILHYWPHSGSDYLNPSLRAMELDSGTDADEAFTAWQQGRTGFPIVDAGMRQLLHEGWMHNRVRMLAASFLVKDLHLEWTRGAQHFMNHLIDGDTANNSHGWQWVAGCGTDASPYFRIFNPITQGRKFDPDARYITRWVPELRGLPAAVVHQPWTNPGGTPAGYPSPIVDHDVERREALRRYHAIGS